MKHDFEQIRDNIEKEFAITAVNEAVRHDPELSASFTSRDLGIKAMGIVDQAWDGQTNQIDINAAIQKINKAANKESKKEFAAKELIKSFLSKGYYGYMLLRKAIGHKLEHPVLRPWYANELFRIPSLVNPGGKVYLTEGTFSLSAQISALSNLVLEGSGWQHTKLLMAGNVSAINLAAYNNITIRELEIDGNSRAYSPESVIRDTGSAGAGCDDVTIENIYMHDHQAEYGIEMWNGNRLRILNSRFTKIGQSGSGDSDPVSIQMFHDIQIKNNWVYDSVYEHRSGAIEVQDGSGLMIVSGNHVNKAQQGIYVSVHAADEIQDRIIVANNIVETYNVNLETTVGNIYPIGICVGGFDETTGRTTEAAIIGNVVRHNINNHTAYSGEWSAGIRIRRIIGALVDGNVVDNRAINQEKGNNGIEIGPYTEDAVISNNVCINCYLAGIAVWDTGTKDIVISGNRCGGNDRGIHIHDSDYIFVSNNDVRGNTTAAITVASGKNANGWVINNPGHNPVGNFTSPSVPASTVAYTNQYGYPCMVSVYGGTVTVIAIDAVATGLTSGTFVVAHGETISLTYSAAPTWVWYGV